MSGDYGAFEAELGSRFTVDTGDCYALNDKFIVAVFDGGNDGDLVVVVSKDKPESTSLMLLEREKLGVLAGLLIGDKYNIVRWGLDDGDELDFDW